MPYNLFSQRSPCFPFNGKKVLSPIRARMQINPGTKAGQEHISHRRPGGGRIDHHYNAWRNDAAMVPPAAISPTVSPLGYFCSSISGPMILPIAAALATPDPETAPKNPQAAVPWPQSARHFPQHHVGKPHEAGRTAVYHQGTGKINIGIAIILKDLAPLAMRWTTISSGG